MKIDLNENPRKEEVQFKHKQLEAGVFGKLFGTGSNASSNIAGLVVIGLLFVIFWVIGSMDSTDIETVLKIISPVLTLTLGYLFGKHA